MHGDPELVEAVRRGRADEFGPSSDAPDPQSEATFESAKLDWTKREQEPHAALLSWYRALMQLRAERPALARLDTKSVRTDVFEEQRAIVVLRQSDTDSVAVVLAFDDDTREIDLTIPGGPWSVLLDTHADERHAITLLGANYPVTVQLPARSALVLGT